MTRTSIAIHADTHVSVNVRVDPDRHFSTVTIGSWNDNQPEITLFLKADDPLLAAMVAVSAARETANAD